MSQVEFGTHYRSHYCGEVTESLIGKTVKLAGWVRRRRDHGGLVFVDLSDFSGRVQLVFNPEVKDAFSLAESVRSEYVIQVDGLVVARPEGTTNADLKTGGIDIHVQTANLLSSSEVPPFSPDDMNDAKEELRLKYRFLDLRRPEMQAMLRKRAQVYTATRSYLNDKGFCEVETPILSKPTPEGARDFLVPSRMQHGSFYALPQSPQLFKQVLMCSGLDKYYQIVKCFRDEDFRANRQPEFTQIDIEMSFVGEDDVVKMAEGLIKKIWKDVDGREFDFDFPHMDYDDVMMKYGVDAPDVRFDLEIQDVTELFKKCNSEIIQGIIGTAGVVRGFLAPDESLVSRKVLDEWTAFVSQYGAKGLAWFKNEGGTLKGPMAKFFPEDSHAECIKAFGLEDGGVFLSIAGGVPLVCSSLGALRVHVAKKLDLIDSTKLSFVWVKKFPLLEMDASTGRYHAVHHPFTSPDINSDADQALLDKDPLLLKAKAYDLVLNGQEIGGGSIRIFDQKLQSKIFSLLGISEEEARIKFGFLLDALSFGAPPHGGIAFGVDRIAMILSGEESIRDVIAFPKTQRGTDIMVGAPSVANIESLVELGIKVIVPNSNKQA